ncbi:MarR family winged helix-turn-helix transcriptional regulator [Hyphobacterium sp.]|uniref:MarR family winged helix-turn-helix transcriptional regulator n=1 Tax=Hyphobacterium sp. TaxID=2004662 RepID=UPI0037498F26
MSRQDDVLIAVRRIMRAVDLHSKKLMKASGLTSSQRVVLQTLSQSGPSTPGTIARDVSLSHATVTVILDRLGERGLITRQRSQTDRRNVMVDITDSGRQCLADAPEALQAGFLKSFGDLADWEQLMLIASLQRVAELMSAEDVDAAPILDVGDVRRTGMDDSGNGAPPADGDSS